MSLSSQPRSRIARARLRRGFAAFCYVTVLLFAQQLAYSHAAWHAGAQSEHQHKSDASFHGKLCGSHGAFSQILGGIHGAAALVLPAAQCASTIERPLESFVSRSFSGPHSRAPPAFS